MNERKPVVLVAEDDASVRLALDFVLKYEGFEIVFAEDGEKAVEVAKQALPDVILLDRLMPKMDGLEVLRALKENKATSRIPILILTGMAPHEDMDWQGAEFVGKPFSPDELVKRIKGLLKPVA